MFILTHNFTFFRQVRNWFHHLKGQNKKDITQRPARFFMLDCVHNQDRRCAGIRRLDRLLERFESEYHYLFAYIHRTASASPSPELIRILRFLHTHSHSDALGEPEHDLSLLSEAQAILSDLLDLMRSQDVEHFTAMEMLISTAEDEDH